MENMKNAMMEKAAREYDSLVNFGLIMAYAGQRYASLKEDEEILVNEDAYYPECSELAEKVLEWTQGKVNLADREDVLAFLDREDIDEAMKEWYPVEKTFCVTVYVKYAVQVEIEAKDEEDARVKARQRYDYDVLQAYEDADGMYYEDPEVDDYDIDEAD